MVEPNPITYRMIGKLDVPDPDAVVVCNCRWDEGHEPTCDIVEANRIILGRAYKKLERRMA
jgi:hypothetical protein